MTCPAFGIGAITAAAVTMIALRVRALTQRGAIAAFLVGTASFGGLGVPGAIVLLAFFISSVSLSRLGKARKRGLLNIGKQGGARDAGQVLANGGVAALCALLTLDGHAALGAVAFAGAFAAATADTWGTEIGTLVARSPHSILTGAPIASGLSGGISIAGTLAEIVGALFIALVANMVGFHAFLAITVGGISGALIDSLLGATLQALHWCPPCEQYCEMQTHVCGTRTELRRGLRWISNDVVNLAATAAGAVIAAGLAMS